MRVGHRSGGQVRHRRIALPELALGFALLCPALLTAQQAPLRAPSAMHVARDPGHVLSPNRAAVSVAPAATSTRWHHVRVGAVTGALLGAAVGVVVGYSMNAGCDIAFADCGSRAPIAVWYGSIGAV